uniref:zinc finger BED domain-containing protein 1-like n=1 Tax=Maylandia zebra TaxID=106582 RepID=UPI000D323A6F|nr:zinc finger BED domain-containing protein 1-like [Maylandia zebra]
MSAPSREKSTERTEENTDDSSNAEEIVERKGRKSSVVWRYFGYLKSDKKQSSTHCKLCRQHVPTKTGNTTNLFHHLKQCHPQEHAQSLTESANLSSKTTGGIPAKQQQSIESAFSSVLPYDKKAKRHSDITNAIAYCLAKDMLPINTVENEGFKQLIKVLDPRYQLPGRKHFSQIALPMLYRECREAVEKELQTVSFFATTSDMWSSRTSEPYLSLTAHYIDQDWNLKSKCLQAAYLPDDHTGEVIALGLSEALASWGLSEDKQVCITTDSGTNIVKATSLNNWTRLQCFGHRLHSAIEKAGKDKRMERAVAVCKRVVATFSFSWKKKRELAAAQEELHLPQHKLVTESPTRWGSRQKMVGRVLEQHKAISQVLSADKKTRHLVPSWQDLDVLESVHVALNPLLEFTDSLSGECYVSVSYLKPMLHLFRTQILKPSEVETQLTKDLKMTVMTYLDEKYNDQITNELLDVATLLDPRFKVQYINAEHVDAIKMRAVYEMLGQIEHPSTSAGTEETEDGGAAAVLPTQKKQRKSLGSFFKKSHPTSTGLTEKETVEKELEKYLLAPDADSEMDPLEWWKINNRSFPRVSCLAKRYLCIPATSSPSERVFSTGGNIVTCHRAALKPEAVDRLVFLSHNL